MSEPGDPNPGQPGWWIADLWLLFLVFPLVTMWAVDALSTTTKVVASLLVVVYGIAHAVGFRVFHVPGGPSGAGLPWYRRVRDRREPHFWFALMLVTGGAAGSIGGFAMLGLVPFVVSFAMFLFSWRTAAITVAASTALVVGLPLAVGRLDDLWFFIVILWSVAGGTALLRLTEEQQIGRAALETRLAVVAERDRVARDVHDVLGHSLTAIVLKAQVVDRLLDGLADADADAVEALRTHVHEIDDVGRRALSEIRATVGGLRTSNVADELAAARAVLADADVSLTVSGDASLLPEHVRPVLGWVVREAVTNIVRHARAESCTIAIGKEPLLDIRDDGRGFEEAAEGNGLRGLRERLAAIGAGLVIESDVAGTRLVVSGSEPAA